MTDITFAPPPARVLFEAEPFIPYVKEEDFAPNLRPVLEPYKKRMGFLPNALKLYAYRPEIAETLWALNSKVMRDPSSTLTSSSSAGSLRSSARSMAAAIARRTAARC